MIWTLVTDRTLNNDNRYDKSTSLSYVYMLMHFNISNIHDIKLYEIFSLSNEKSPMKVKISTRGRPKIK